MQIHSNPVACWSKSQKNNVSHSACFFLKHVKIKKIQNYKTENPMLTTTTTTGEQKYVWPWNGPTDIWAPVMNAIVDHRDTALDGLWPAILTQLCHSPSFSFSPNDGEEQDGSDLADWEASGGHRIHLNSALTYSSSFGMSGTDVVVVDPSRYGEKSILSMAAAVTATDSKFPYASSDVLPHSRTTVATTGRLVRLSRDNHESWMKAFVERCASSSSSREGLSYGGARIPDSKESTTEGRTLVVVQDEFVFMWLWRRMLYVLSTGLSGYMRTYSPKCGKGTTTLAVQ